MESIIVKIDNKETKKSKNGSSYLVFTLNGMRYNSFDMALDKFNVGETVEAILEKEGQYMNLKELRPSKVEISSPMASKQEFHLSPKQVKTNALMAAIEFRKGSSIAYECDSVELGKLLVLAGNFEKFINGLQN